MNKQSLRLYVNILKENILILQSRVEEMATKQPEQRYLTLLCDDSHLKI